MGILAASFLRIRMAQVTGAFHLLQVFWHHENEFWRNPQVAIVVLMLIFKATNKPAGESA
jgi:hypothetical protein